MWDNLNLDVLISGGTLIKEPVIAYGPFAMYNKAQFQQTFDHCRSGSLELYLKNHR